MSKEEINVSVCVKNTTTLTTFPLLPLPSIHHQSLSFSSTFNCFFYTPQPHSQDKWQSIRSILRAWSQRFSDIYLKRARPFKFAVHNFHSNWKMKSTLPRPLRPTNLRSLNFATRFFMTAVALRNSAHGFSSLPAFMVATVPSAMSPRATTLKADGNVLLDLQWEGSAEHKKYGFPVRTNSPGGYSDRMSFIMRSVHHSPSWLVVLSAMVSIFLRLFLVVCWAPALSVDGAIDITGSCIEYRRGTARNKRWTIDNRIKHKQSIIEIIKLHRNH